MSKSNVEFSHHNDSNTKGNPTGSGPICIPTKAADVHLPITDAEAAGNIKVTFTRNGKDVDPPGPIRSPRGTTQIDIEFTPGEDSPSIRRFKFLDKEGKPIGQIQEAPESGANDIHVYIESEKGSFTQDAYWTDADHKKLEPLHVPPDSNDFHFGDPNSFPGHQQLSHASYYVPPVL